MKHTAFNCEGAVESFASEVMYGVTEELSANIKISIRETMKLDLPDI